MAYSAVTAKPSPKKSWLEWVESDSSTVSLHVSRPVRVRVRLARRQFYSQKLPDGVLLIFHCGESKSADRRTWLTDGRRAVACRRTKNWHQPGGQAVPAGIHEAL